MQYLFYSFIMIFLLIACDPDKASEDAVLSVTYYIDSSSGNDNNAGTSEVEPWRSLSKMEQAELHPGDTIRFRRGSSFTGPLYINYSGAVDDYIVLTDYGDASSPAPSFTNPVFKQDNFGNCIRITGDYVVVENLYFHNTSAYVAGNYQTDGWDTWEMGAIYIDKGADHCIVRDNEIEDCVVGIKSYGQHTIIEHNYIHDCNRVLKEWTWGPIGIWLGADYQEVCYNRIFNYRAEDPRISWPNGTGGGADGGAMEIDDARNNKSHISIHHNYTHDCQGFLEVTWSDVQSSPTYENFSIHHNVSDDYQQFIALWNGANCSIDNNTIIRRKMNANDWGVLNITQDNSRNKIRNNIIITEDNIPIFNVGLSTDHHPDNLIQNNLYYAASGELEMGKEGPGESPVYAKPLLVNYQDGTTAKDFAIGSIDSPAIDRGQDLGYERDFEDTKIPKGKSPDIGAFEFSQ